MGHQIAHRFTKTFKVKATCEYCKKPIFFGTGLKCKECKYKCHRDCEDKVKVVSFDLSRLRLTCKIFFYR